MKKIILGLLLAISMSATAQWIYGSGTALNLENSITFQNMVEFFTDVSKKLYYTDINDNTVTLGSNNPELLNRLPYPSFEEAITSVTISGGTGSSETTETFDGSRSLGWALSAETGAATGTVADTRLSGVQIEASCYVKTSASGVVFKAQRNGSDIAGLSIDVPNDDTWRLIGIPFVGGSTSSGFQIEATGSITDSIFIDQCSVGTDFRVNDFSQVTGAELLVSAVSNAGQSITANTTDIPFTEVSDPYGLWDGDSFTAPDSDSIYTICASLNYSANANHWPGLWENGSYYKSTSNRSDSAENSAGMSCYVGKLTAGNSYSLRDRSGGGTLAASTTQHWITISRVKSANTITLGPDNFTGLTKGQMYTIPSSAGFGTIDTANTDLEYRRVADKLVIDGFITPGTTTGVTANIGLPTGFTIRDPSPRVGGYWFTSASSNTHGGAVLLTPGTSYIEFSTNGVFGGDVISPTTAANGDQVVGTGVKFHIHVEIPIEGWDQGAAVVEIDPCQTRSTSETACAQWWVDGSRIYQRCATDSSVRSASFTIATFATGLTPISFEGTWRENSSGEWFLINYTSNGTNANYVSGGYQPSSGAVTIGISTWSSSETHICMKYIKP